MALLTISGDPASPWEEVARIAAQLLGFELVTETRLSQWIAEEFGPVAVSARAWHPAALSLLAQMAREQHLVTAVPGVNGFPPMPILLRANITVHHEMRRAGAHAFDLILNAANMSAPQMAEVLRAAVHARDQAFLPASVEAQIQFETRLKLARHGLAPRARSPVKPIVFGHPSEQMFANLLDFYRIRWDYEPRSFPLQWDKDGRVTEAFTPDFYLHEPDLYVELTTMKQSHVTRKNRKVKMLRAIYPHINIQVFYQKDFQDLIFKYGTAMAANR